MMSKERPILFSGEMVRAILDGRKTQTQRVIRWSEKSHEEEGALLLEGKSGAYWPYNCHSGNENPVACPYGVPGDRLWVREAFRFGEHWNGNHNTATNLVNYRADGEWRHLGLPTTPWTHEEPNNPEDKWRPSIFMPRWASRITLEVTAVRVERVQDISEEDATAEGLESFTEYHTMPGKPHLQEPYRQVEALEQFEDLWDRLNKKRGYVWEKNPWVWVVTFRKISS